MSAQYLQVQTSIDTRDEASALMRSVVEARLAACAKIVGPITSAYWWEGELETDEEWLVLMKTPAARYEELQAHIKQHHSYDVPEILAFPVVAGNPDYLEWLTEETGTRAEPA